MEMEIKEWCSQSVIEMKKGIASTLSKYKFNADTISRLRIMINACNTFLDDLTLINRPGIIYKHNNGDWEDLRFSKAMKKFRKVFKENISSLFQSYQISFPSEIPD